MAERNRFIEKWTYIKRMDCEPGGLDESIEELKDCIDPRYASSVSAEISYILTNEDQSVPLYMLWNGNLYKVEKVK